MSQVSNSATWAKERKVLVSVFGSVGNHYSRYLTLRGHEKALTLHVDLGKTNEILLK